ncbi:MAG: 1-phosphofructokinase [Sporolactobacillus sp.]|jgi:1-phosphofructokinase|nr:1-phosphofructokinase [Sporolactobacillus sp.]MCI1881036.1 1-phosphofructokinase [Sporolactobacillus sp.]
MIYTVTLNPSVDYIVRLRRFAVGSVNRADSDDKFPGGKGINVSRMLQHIRLDSVALGFLGGFTGRFIADRLKNEGIRTRFTSIARDTRINIKLKDGGETEINGAGPMISQQELQAFRAEFNALQAGDIVVLSGSAPASLGNRFYETLVSIIKSKNADFVIDIEGDTLIRTLAHRPLLIKPNNRELGAIYGRILQTKEQILPYGKKLLRAGAQHVIVSMAGNGALLFTTEAVYFAPPIRGTVKNSVGAGDSMIAGFVGKYHETRDPVQAFRWGVACGTATAFSDDLASGAFILDTLRRVEIVNFG